MNERWYHEPCGAASLRQFGTTARALLLLTSLFIAAAGCGSNQPNSIAENTDSSVEASTTTVVAAVQPMVAPAPTAVTTTPLATTVVAPVTESVTATDPVPTETATTPQPTPAPTIAPTGTRLAADCGPTERFVDDDADGSGECAVTSVEVNSWLAQAAAVEAGVTPGAACGFPSTISVGDTVAVECPVVNGDGSAGRWRLNMTYDGTITAPPSYVETQAAPPPSTAPPTMPPVPLAASTDPRFDTCKAALASGYGHYRRGVDPEYDWYRDADSDGVVCE